MACTYRSSVFQYKSSPMFFCNGDPCSFAGALPVAFWNSLHYCVSVVKSCYSVKQCFVDLMGVPCGRENRLIKVGDQPFDLVNRRWGKGGRDSERRDFSVHLFQSFYQSSTRTEILLGFLHFHFFNLSACKLFWTYFELFLSLPPPLLRPFDFQLGKLKQYIG